MPARENALFEKRFVDLSRQADQKGIVCFSDFLTIHELHILKDAAPRLYGTFKVSGGYPNAERQMAAFLPDALSFSWKYPIDCIEILPAYPKFAQELTHRDILGALMSLGLERSRLGDIVVDECRYYLFVKSEMSPYILEELREIRHTSVKCRLVEPEAAGRITPRMAEHQSTITSNRLDNIVAAFTGRSRSQAVTLIQSGKISVNGNECLHNTYICKSDDVISIRGVGKFIFDGVTGETRKNRIRIVYRQYL